MDGQVQTDSYDSGVSPGAASCAPGCPNRRGTISTDATSWHAMDLERSVVIRGDALVGPGGNPGTAMSVEEGVTITGQRGTEDYVLPMPPVVPPSGLPLRGELNWKGALPMRCQPQRRSGGTGLSWKEAPP